MVYRMAEKRKRTPKVVEPTIVEEVIDTVPEDYIEPVEQELLYSDMLITCNKCGSVQVIGKGIEGNAVQLTITHDEKSFVQLNCDKCDASLRLRIIKGEAPIVEEDKIIELLTDEETVKKIVENPNVEVVSIETVNEETPTSEETPVNEDVPQENKQEEII